MRQATQWTPGLDRKPWLRKVTLVTGGSDYNEASVVWRALDELNPRAVVSGRAPGADTHAEDWCKVYGVPFIGVPAWWSLGKVAGKLRNQWMLDFVKVQVGLAFPGNNGTADMTKRMLQADISVLCVPGGSTIHSLSQIS